MIAIYHSRDLDGIASGRIILEKYPEATLVGYHYGEPFDILPPIGEIPGMLTINGTSMLVTPDTHIIMADVSLPMEKMEALFKNFFFRWIDHKAIRDFEDYFDMSVRKLKLGEAIGVEQGLAYLSKNTASCVLTYGALFDDNVPEVIHLIGDHEILGVNIDFYNNMKHHTVESFPLNLSI